MRVLIVDDNPTNVQYLERLVAKLSQVATVSFTDSAAALAWCAGNEPDLVLVDYVMPGIDGLEFVRRLREMNPQGDIPIVMITTAGETGVRQRAVELGTTDFLHRPVDPNEMMSRMRNLLALRRSQRALQDRAVWLADEVARATGAIAGREEELILRLSRAAEYRHHETGSHLVRMTRYSALIAARLGLGDEACQNLERAAPMHDIGKVGIPDNILLKPGPLDETEFTVMMAHTTIGHAILKDSTSELIQLAAEIALTHHERYDGSGYPFGLAGAEVPIAGRICAVADVFDALTSARPYKAAWSMEAARGYVAENSGGHFDPDCVTAFLAVWPEVMMVRARHGDSERQPTGGIEAEMRG